MYSQSLLFRPREMEKLYKSSKRNDNATNSYSTKQSKSGILKTFFDKKSRDHLECSSSVDIYRKARDIKFEGAVKSRGGETPYCSFSKSNGVLPFSRSVSVDDQFLQADEKSELVALNGKPRGIENLGNTCFLNAIFQCLRSTDVFLQFCLEKRYEDILHKNSKTAGALFPAVANVLTKLHSYSGNVIPSNSLVRFKAVFSKLVPSYSGNLQQDALEFFTYLLNGLHEEIKSNPLSPTPSPPLPERHKHRRHLVSHKRCSSSVADSLPPQRDFDPNALPCSGRVSEKSHSHSPPPDSSFFQEPSLDSDSPNRLTLIKRIFQRRKHKSTEASSTNTCPQSDCTMGVGSAEATAREQSILKDTFVGHLRTRLRCCNCNNMNMRDELFWNLALCVPEVKPTAPGGDCDQLLSSKITDLKEGHSDSSSTSSSSITAVGSSEGDASRHKTSAKDCTEEVPDKQIGYKETEKTRKASTATNASTNSVQVAVSLQDCLSAFTKCEVLDGDDRPTCNTCKSPNKAELQVLVSHLPEILILQFQRFDSACCRTKRRNLIDFGFELDLAPFTTQVADAAAPVSSGNKSKRFRSMSKSSSTPIIQSSDSSSKNYCPVPNLASTSSATSRAEKQGDCSTSLSCLGTPGAAPAEEEAAKDLGNTNYNLYAVVYHRGSTERGHYTAKCLVQSADGKGTWYKFDDENVTQITDLSEIIHPSAYILLYRRVNRTFDDATPRVSTCESHEPVLFEVGSEDAIF